MSTPLITAAFSTPGGPEVAQDILRKHSHQLLVEIAINLMGVILQGYALYAIAQDSPHLHYMGLGFSVLWFTTGMLDNLFLSVWAKRKATLALVAELERKQVSPPNSKTTPVDAQEYVHPSPFQKSQGIREKQQTDGKDLMGRDSRNESLSGDLAGSANILPDGRLLVEDLDHMDPLERHRYIDATLAKGVITGLVYGSSGSGIAGASRDPFCIEDRSASLLPGATSAYADIKVTEAVLALAYLADVDFENWEDLGMSCCCSVVNQDLYGYPAEGGDIVMHGSWDKDVIVVTSSEGYSPKVQEVLHGLAAAAPPQVAVVYQCPDHQEIDSQTPTPTIPSASAQISTTDNSGPSTLYHAGCRDLSDRGFRFDLRVQINENGAAQSYRLKTTIAIYGEEKVKVQAFEAQYSLSGRDASYAVSWDLDRQLFELSPFTPTIVGRGLSAGVNLGMAEHVARSRLTASVHRDVDDEKRLVCRPNPNTDRGWSKLEHVDNLVCRNQQPRTYHAQVEASLKTQINPVVTSRFTATLTLDFEIAPLVPLRDGLNVVIVSYEGDTIQNPITREGCMGYHLKVERSRGVQSFGTMEDGSIPSPAVFVPPHLPNSRPSWSNIISNGRTSSTT